MALTEPGIPCSLLRSAQAGDGPALGQLLELYREYLVLLARVQIGCRLQGKADASDLVQDTFLAAHREFPRFRGTSEGELLNWLREILAMNLAALVRRYYHTQRRNIRLEQQLAQELDQSSRTWERELVMDSSSPSQRAARREQAVLLADALARLSPDYREVIVLRHLEQLRFPEVAERMQRSLDSVKKLWIRALADLRQELGEPE